MPGGGLKNIGAGIKRDTERPGGRSRPPPRHAPPAKAFIAPSRIDAR